MKKQIKLALVAALALGSTSVFATNGSNLIGMGAKARAMGGTTIGMGHGAESGLSNPALITSVKGTEISFGGTLFMPTVSSDGGMSGFGAPTVDSTANLNVIPEVSIASKVNDNFYWGIGMYGTAGMGVDYRHVTNNPGTMNMVTNLQLMQFGVPLTYVTNGFSIGFTPVLQYGSLDMNYNNQGTEVGEGVSQDLQFGYNLGVAYELAGFTIGAVYKAQIDMEYNGQMSSATQPFVDMGIFPGLPADELSTPAEIGFGMSYNMAEHTIAFDYKQIAWSDAKGYDMFQWEDQDVIALGYQYKTKGWALRLGYNYAESPIKDAGAMTLAEVGAAMMANGESNPMDATKYLGGNAINTFNLAGFPATVETHITLGGSYEINDRTTLDLAYAYVPETSTTLQTMPADTMNNGTGAPGQDGMPDTDIETTVTHSQQSVSFQLSYNF